MDAEDADFPRPALERLWTPLRVAWEGADRPQGWRLSKDADEWKLSPRLPRNTAQSWIDPWQTEPVGQPPLPRSFDMFFTFVRLLGAEEDLDNEPDLQDLPDPQRRWERLYQAAKDEADQAAAARRARRSRSAKRRRPRRSRQRSALWRTSAVVGGSLIALGVIIALVVAGGGTKNLRASASSTCANVTDGPAGVYPSPDTQTKPIKWKNDTDRVVVMHHPVAPRGWVVVFTPKNDPGYQWMLDRQLGPEGPCRAPLPGS